MIEIFINHTHAQLNVSDLSVLPLEDKKKKSLLWVLKPFPLLQQYDTVGSAVWHWLRVISGWGGTDPMHTQWSAPLRWLIRGVQERKGSFISFVKSDHSDIAGFLYPNHKNEEKEKK